MIINNKYRGNQAIAVTKFGNDYAVKVASSVPELRQLLKDDRKLLRREHETLAVYRKVDPRLCLPIIERATYDIRHGKHINLENLLA